MTDLPVENKHNWIIEFFKSVWKFILRLLRLDGSQHKCACGSKCGSNCFCDGCILTIGYSEKEEDGSDIDIHMTQEEIDIA